MATDVSIYSFITRDQARASLNLHGQNTEQDGLLVDLINRATQLFEMYTGRKLMTRQYVESYLDGTGTEFLYLPEYPVTVIAGISMDEDRVFDEVLVEDTNYVWDEESGEVTLIDDTTWPEGKQTVKITYTAGFDPVEVLDIAQAQIAQVMQWWFEVGRDPQLAGTSMGGITQQLKDRALSQNSELVLMAYKRPACLA